MDWQIHGLAGAAAVCKSLISNLTASNATIASSPGGFASEALSHNSSISNLVQFNHYDSTYIKPPKG